MKKIMLSLATIFVLGISAAVAQTDIYTISLVNYSVEVEEVEFLDLEAVDGSYENAVPFSLEAVTSTPVEYEADELGRTFIGFLVIDGTHTFDFSSSISNGTHFDITYDNKPLTVTFTKDLSNNGLVVVTDTEE